MFIMNYSISKKFNFITSNYLIVFCLLIESITLKFYYLSFKYLFELLSKSVIVLLNSNLCTTKWIQLNSIFYKHFSKMKCSFSLFRSFFIKSFHIHFILFLFFYFISVMYLFKLIIDFFFSI